MMINFVYNLLIVFVQCDDVQKHPKVQQDEDDEARKGSIPEDCCSDSMSLSVEPMTIRSQSVISNSLISLHVCFRVLPLLSVPGCRHVPGQRKGLV